jgi:hypothetical protein
MSDSGSLQIVAVPLTASDTKPGEAVTLHVGSYEIIRNLTSSSREEPRGAERRGIDKVRGEGGLMLDPGLRLESDSRRRQPAV